MDTGDFVVVVNAEKIHVTGQKLDQKLYYRHSGYPGGLRRHLARAAPPPARVVLRRAVNGMIPKNRLAAAQLGKLKVYAGPRASAWRPEPRSHGGRTLVPKSM